MYDYIKGGTYQKGLAERLLKHPLLNFVTKVDNVTGEIIKYRAKYKNLKFIVYPSGWIEMKGSIHKYWNDGLHNWNQFTLADVRRVLDDLQETFGIDPTLVTVHNLEFGMNVLLPYSPDRFLSNLVVHKKEQFNKMKISGQGNGRYAYYSQYEVKVYNKGLHYSRPDNILRFEKKITKMECIRPQPIKLIDLKEQKLFTLLQGQLLDCFDEIIFKDKVDVKLLTKPELKLYNKCKDSAEWEEMTPEARYKNKLRFNQLIATHGKSNYKDLVRGLLIKTGHVLTGILEENKSLNDRSYSMSEHDFLLSDNLQLYPVLNEVA